MQSPKHILILKASLAPNILDLNTQLNPLFTYNSKQPPVSAVFNYQAIQNQYSVYWTYLCASARLYTFSIDKTDGASDITTEAWGTWDSDTITTHRMILSRPISLGAGTLTPSLTSVLPPLVVSVTPRLQFRQEVSIPQWDISLFKIRRWVQRRCVVAECELRYDRVISLSWNSTYDTSIMLFPVHRSRGIRSLRMARLYYAY